MPEDQITIVIARYMGPNKGAKFTTLMRVPTEENAQAFCSDPRTHGKDWFAQYFHEDPEHPNEADSAFVDDMVEVAEDLGIEYEMV